MLKKRTNTERLLVEHPWLWSVSTCWFPGHNEITVTELTLKELEIETSQEEWWFVLSFGGVFGRVSKLEHDEPGCIGWQLIRLLVNGEGSGLYKLKYLVSKKAYGAFGFGRYTLYRVPSIEQFSRDMSLIRAKV